MAKTICVDPGHGMSNRVKGIFDPGAVHQEGDTKFEEATIALHYGLALRQALQARGASVFMTRDDATDHAPVGQRAANAKAAGCDTFISFHLNDFDDDAANGFEVLYGSNAQKPFAEAVHKTVLAVVKLKDRQTKLRTDLAVLKFGGPAALIELGFIANDHDRETILNPAVRHNVCQALAAMLTS